MADAQKKSLAKRYVNWRKEAKGDAGRAVGVTLADTAIAVGVGGLTGAFFGPLGILGGLGLTCWGHYAGASMATTVGASMLAGSLYAPQSTRPAPENGDTFDTLEHQLDMAWDRLKLATGAAKDKFSLAPAQPASTQQQEDRAAELLEQAVNGLTSVPSLDEIEAQVEQSAIAFNAGSPGQPVQSTPEPQQTFDMPVQQALPVELDELPDYI